MVAEKPAPAVPAKVTAENQMVKNSRNVLEFPQIKKDVEKTSERGAISTNTAVLNAGPQSGPWNSQWVYGNEAPLKRAMILAENEPGPSLKGSAQGDHTFDAESLQKLINEMGLKGEIENISLDEPSLSEKGMKSQSIQQKVQRKGVDSISGNSSLVQNNEKSSEMINPALGVSPGAWNDLSASKDILKQKQGVAGKIQAQPSPTLIMSGGEMVKMRQNLEKPAMTGFVVPGSMTKDRMSRQSVNELSDQIGIASAMPRGGEVRIRLHPEHLGELVLRVRTNGNSVGIQVKATDEKAKKILEESVSALRDTLQQQHLNLQNVEVAVVPEAFSKTMDMDRRSDADRSYSNQKQPSADYKSARDFDQHQKSKSRWGNEDGLLDITA